MDRLKPKTPYFEKVVACPVCGEESIHHYLKDRVYVVDKREPDLFISKYHWIDPAYNRFNLYFFYFWHCPFCKFTDERRVFFEKKKSNYAVRHPLLELYNEKASDDPVIKHLSQYITYPSPDYFSVLLLHLLATYIQLIPEKNQRNIEKVARYFHRTVWIYRLELGAEQEEEKSILTAEYLKRFNMLQSNCMNTLASLEDLHQWLDMQIAADKEQNANKWATQEENAKSLYRIMTQHMDDILVRLQAYHNIGLYHEAKQNSERSQQTDGGFHGYDSFIEYILEIKDFWPDIPISDHTATQKAIESYLETIRAQLYSDRIFKHFQIYRLVIYLYQGLGDTVSALEFIDRLLEQVLGYRESAHRRLRRIDVLKDDRINPALLENHIYRANDIIEDVRHQKNEICEEMLELEIENAKAIFTNNRDLSPAELREKLREANIREEVILQFVEEKEREKKKGIFNIFKF